MKLLLVGVNAKYVHTNLAIRYLYQKTKNICDSYICEYSINDNYLSVERSIILQNPDIVSFSCYIWNIDIILMICSDLKKMKPDMVIILGGPEVSYDSKEILEKNPYIDYIIRGEGETSFLHLIRCLTDNSSIPEKGVAYRKGNIIEESCLSAPVCFDDIPFPYDFDSEDLTGKILYYESSRGCPYSCKYCLSGEKGNVRFKDVEKVKKDLSFFDSKNIPLVKFVDRTFNADKKRAIELWKHISELKGNTRFHMEITGELLNDETVEVLKSIPSEKLQFEIGVQSTNEKTLDAIDRVCNKERLFKYIKKILAETDIHIHLDLISGLPYEDIKSFENSFNDVISLRPHVLQLGFLKVLKGSAIRNEADKYGIIYRDKSPYEIISSKYMSYEDILFLKDMDFVFDKYYNSGSFVNAFEFLLGKIDNPYSVFSDLVMFFRKNNIINTSFSKEKLYGVLYECFKAEGTSFEKALRKDYIISMHPGKLPQWCNTDENFKISDEVYAFLKDEEIKSIVMPEYYNVPAKAIIKHFRFEKFDTDVLAFDYTTDKVYDVTEYFK